MEMLIFFFVSLFAGVLAAYLAENNRRNQTDRYSGSQYGYGDKQDMKSTFQRLQRISRQF